MPPSQSGRRSKLVSGARTRLRPAALPSDNVGLNVSPSLLAKDQPYRVKKAKRARCPNTSDQYSAEPERLVVPSPHPSTRSTRSISANARSLLMSANQAVPHEKTALLKATFILNGTPILISWKIASHNPETKLHTMDIVSLELFSANKKTLPLKSTLMQTTTLSSIREQDHEYNAPLSPLTAIRPVPRRESEDLAAQLLTTLDDSLGNKAVLPTLRRPSSIHALHRQRGESGGKDGEDGAVCIYPCKGHGCYEGSGIVRAEIEDELGRQGRVRGQSWREDSQEDLESVDRSRRMRESACYLSEGQKHADKHELGSCRFLAKFWSSQCPRIGLFRLCLPVLNFELCTEVDRDCIFTSARLLSRTSFPAPASVLSDLTYRLPQTDFTGL